MLLYHKKITLIEETMSVDVNVSQEKTISIEKNKQTNKQCL